MIVYVKCKNEDIIEKFVFVEWRSVEGRTVKMKSMKEQNEEVCVVCGRMKTRRNVESSGGGGMEDIGWETSQKSQRRSPCLLKKDYSKVESRSMNIRMWFQTTFDHKWKIYDNIWKSYIRKNKYILENKNKR